MGYAIQSRITTEDPENKFIPDYGRILVGIQVPAADEAAFRSFLETLAYPYVEESANPVYRLFLR